MDYNSKEFNEAFEKVFSDIFFNPELMGKTKVSDIFFNPELMGKTKVNQQQKNYVELEKENSRLNGLVVAKDKQITEQRKTIQVMQDQKEHLKELLTNQSKNIRLVYDQNEKLKLENASSKYSVEVLSNLLKENEAKIGSMLSDIANVMGLKVEYFRDPKNFPELLNRILVYVKFREEVRQALNNF